MYDYYLDVGAPPLISVLALPPWPCSGVPVADGSPMSAHRMGVEGMVDAPRLAGTLQAV